MISAGKVFAVIMVSILLAGCGEQQATPSKQVTEGTLILADDFEDIDASAFPSYALGDDLVFGVSDGIYAAIATEGGYVWTLNNQTHNNAVIEVTTSRVSAGSTDTYGVICRAHTSNNGMGYYFLINANGNFGIRKGDGERVRVLVPWTSSRAIRSGNRENTLRVVCVDDYLAFYINGEFVAEAHDSQFVEGLTGFAVANDSGRIAITYDNLTIHEATISDIEAN